jgi:protein SCO1
MHCRVGQLGLAITAALSLAPAASAQYYRPEPPEAKEVTLDPRLGSQVPEGAVLTDWKGRTVKLGDYLNQGKPVVLTMVYYNCPLICPLGMQRLQDRVNGVPFTVGTDFNVVVVSFNPSDTTAQAAANRDGWFTGYDKPKTSEVEKGWTFHTATTDSARSIAESIGFRYRFLPDSGEYAHPSILAILTPEGKVSGYLSGLDAGPGELRAALLQASEGKIAKSWGDFFIHRCFRFDPRTGKYSMQVTRVMQLVCILTVAGLGTLIAGLKAGERARAMRRAARDRRAESGAAAAANAPLGVST